MGEKKDAGHVVYSRPEGEGGRDGARPSVLQKAAAVAADRTYAPLWRTLVPLLVGFALLVALVIGLGTLSVGKVRDVTFDTRDDDARLALMSGTLLNLRLALSRLDTEARIRGRIDAGTGGVMLPPSDLRLRNERGEVEKLLVEFDRLPLADPAKKQDVHDRVAAHVSITKDLREYSLKGFESARDLDERLRVLMKDVAEERARLDDRRFETLRLAVSGIKTLMWLAALTGLVVATATFLEVWRRFRQIGAATPSCGASASSARRCSKACRAPWRPSTAATASARPTRPSSASSPARRSASPSTTSSRRRRG